MAECQPIETAPKDGTRFLAYFGDTIALAYWYKGKKRWQGESMQAWQCKDDQPTHWMPLPERPR